MARFTFRLPDIGEGIAEAEIVAWHVKPGDRITEDMPIADMMTDKATIELETPVTGIIVELAGEAGDRIAIGAPLAVIETEREVAAEPAVPEALPQSDGLARAVRSTSEPAPARPGKVLASPAVRARAKALGINLADVHTAGDHLRHADLDAFLRHGAAQGYRPPQTSHARGDEQVKVIGLRRRIAENMAASKRHIPHFTYVEEIDVTALETMRAQLNDKRGERPRLSVLPCLIVAICKTVPAFPMINARYDDDAGVVTRHGRVHLGIATQTNAGLMVPVIRDAQDRNVWQLAAEIARLAQAARDGSAVSEELSGSTLTISAMGPLSGIASTPVINRPEVAIIAPGKIVERPVFIGDDIGRAKLMNLSISCDHRVVDGWDAASFVASLKRTIEAPALLFQE